MLYCSIVESICVSVREPNASYFSPSLEYNWLFKRDVHDNLGSNILPKFFKCLNIIVGYLVS